MLGPSVDIWSAPRWRMDSVSGMILWLRGDVGITLNSTTATVLVDGDMEAVGTAAWASALAALSKQSSAPYPGGVGVQCLRVTATPAGGISFPQAVQNKLQIGKEYSVTGWARSDGTCVPKFFSGSGADVWVGTSSTSWQPISGTFVANTANAVFYFAVTGPGGTEYVEFDNVSIVRTTAEDVTAWADQGPDANNGVAVGVEQPTIVAASATLNGQPTLDFNGTTNGISLTAAWPIGGYTSNDYTLYAAVDDHNTASTHSVFGASLDLRFCSARTNLVSIYDGAWRQGPAAVTGPQILKWEVDSSVPEVRFYRNGVHIGTEPYDGTGPLPRNNVDVGAYLSATTYYFNGEIAEIALFDRIITAEESATADASLALRYIP